MIDPNAIARARRALGSQLAAYRQAAGYNQHQLAPQTHYGRSTIANVEVGRQNAPRGFWERCDRALQAEGALLRGYDELVALVAEQRRETAELKSAAYLGGLNATGSALAGTSMGADLVESPFDIFKRLRRAEKPRVTSSLLDALDAFVGHVTDSYETAGPVDLSREVVRQRRWVERLIGVKNRASEQRHLLRIAGQLSAQLGYMAVNLGRFRSAQAYSAEAFQLADLTADDDLRAWIRGTESLAAYYNADFGRALELTRDGQRYAKNGRQAVRLAVNGEARAMAQLGDRRGTEEAIGRAFEVASRQPSRAGMTACISFGGYSEARTASNAATAHLALGDTDRVLEYAERATWVADASPSLWSRALIRLDTATALVRARRPDIERATLVGREAMAAIGSHRLESIQQRTRSLVVDVRPWHRMPDVSDFLDEARDWLSQDWQRNNRAG